MIGCIVRDMKIGGGGAENCRKRSGFAIMEKSSCGLHDNMENAFTKCSSGRGDVANFIGIQRETMWVLKILLHSSQLPFRHCFFFNAPSDLKHLFISFALLDRGVDAIVM